MSLCLVSRCIASLCFFVSKRWCISAFVVVPGGEGNEGPMGCGEMPFDSGGCCLIVLPWHRAGPARRARFHSLGRLTIPAGSLPRTAS